MPALDGMSQLARMRSGLAQLRLSECAAAAGRCPYCGPTLFVRLNLHSGGLRCARCSAGVVQLSLGWALREEVGSVATLDVCELSARGALAAYLRRNARTAATSEYFPDIVPGSVHDGARVEDVQRLTYADASFDLVTHTEVLEHVPDDARALAELLRVLCPGAIMLFTVPLHSGTDTVERARVRDGAIEHLLEPAYHIDPLQPAGILAFRDYGLDIVDRVRAAGFADVRISPPSKRLGHMPGRAAIVARKGVS
jgi:SAM-dependent methyltransferase